MELPVENPQLKKSFIYKHWLILLVGLVSLVGLSVVILILRTREEKVESNKDSSTEKDSYGILDDRITASFLPESGAAFKYNSPTIVDDHIYIGTSEKLSFDGDPTLALQALHDNYFYKMDLDLNVVWEYSLGKSMVIGAGVLDSEMNVYFLTETFVVGDASSDASSISENKDRIFLTTMRLVSLTNDGNLLWERQIGEANEPWDHSMLNLAISSDDRIYFGHEDFLAYDTDGRVLWEYPGADQHFVSFSSSPIIDASGHVYYVANEPVDQHNRNGSENFYVYKFTPSGDIAWRTLIGNEPRLTEGPIEVGGERWNSDLSKMTASVSIPSFGVGERSVYSLIGCTANKIDTLTGELLWSFTPDGCTGAFLATPAVDALDAMYVGTKSNTESTLYAISGEGDLLWETLIGADLYTSPLLGDDHMLYTGSETVDTGKYAKTGKYYKIDMDTGEIEWTIGQALSDFSLGSGALYDGYIYIGVHQVPEGSGLQPRKTLFKIAADTEEYYEDAPWPRFHGGNENTGRSE